MKASAILAAAGFSGLTIAHGLVSQMTIDGKTYGGYSPYVDVYQNPRPERVGWTMPSNGPVEDVSSKAIVCNTNSEPGALVAPASAGSQIEFFWTEWPESHRGPTMTYLAACPSGDCRTEDPSTLDWFKIDHAGLNSDGTWISDTIIANNSTWTVTIPKELKAGAYLLRHELLALHAAHQTGGAQFYPMCVNLEVTGTGTGVPESTVKFPGAYKADDAGIFLNIYYPVPTSYEIPGPEVATLVSSGATEESESTPTPTPTPEITSPVVETPEETEVPETETPETETPETETPETETPETETPETETPETETPETETPETETPVTETPEETPVPEVPETETPETETPETEAPEESPVPEVPETETPETETPETEAPETEVPTPTETPELEFPDTPETETPEETPVPEVPETEAPEETPVPEVPETETPETEVPTPTETPVVESPVEEVPTPVTPTPTPTSTSTTGRTCRFTYKKGGRANQQKRHHREALRKCFKNKD